MVSTDLINQAVRLAAGIVSLLYHLLSCVVCSEAPKVGEKRIYMFTDAGSDFNDNQLDDICGGIRNSDIHITIV